MEYIFCFLEESQGWWLKIDTVDKLTDYHEKTANRWAMVMNDYMRNNDKSRYDLKLTEAVVSLASNRKLTILDGIIQMRFMIAEGQIDSIREYGHIFINAAGGYHSGSTYVQWVRRKELVYPQYTEKDIRIEQFEGGEHWYAYIGDMQIRNGDNLKWNDRTNALTFAKQYVKRANDMEEEHERV